MTEHALAMLIPAIQAMSPEEKVCCAAWHWQDQATISSGTLETHTEKPDELLWFSFRAGIEESLLGIPNTPLFPTLHRLFSARQTLPDELLSALFEEECAPFLTCLGRALGATIRLERSSTPPPPDTTSLWYGSWRAPSSADTMPFCLVLCIPFAQQLASVGTFSLAHPVFADTHLHATVELARFPLPLTDRANLANGDALLLPEWSASPHGQRPLLVIEHAIAVPLERTPEGDWQPHGACTPWMPPEETDVVVEMGAAFTVTLHQVAIWLHPDPRPKTLWVPHTETVRLVGSRGLLAWGQMTRIESTPAFDIEGVEEEKSHECLCG